MEIRMRVSKTGQLKNLKLTTEQYRALGNTMLDAQKRRIAKGINAENHSAKPLAAFYARIKAKMRHTRRPIRDMRLTGLTMDSFQVVRASGGIIRAQPQGPEAQKRATLANYRERMIGFTEFEEKAVVAQARKMFGRNAQLSWEEKG